MNQMAAESGLTVKWSFNADYDTYLPQARGHVLLIETHNGTPIVPVEVLERHFPGSTSDVGQAGGTVRVGKTTIVFLDFSNPLQTLRLGDGQEKPAANKRGSTNGSQPTRSETNRTSSTADSGR
jgi:hypothetical protein